MSQEQDQAYSPRKKVIEMPERNPEGFDIRVHIKDARTGKLIREQHHRCHIVGGIKYYEYPKLSGNLWYENDEPAGRWDKTDAVLHGKPVFGVFPDAPHVAYVAPKNAAETNEELQDENAELRKELAALKAEKDASMKPKVNVQAQTGTPPKA